MQRTESSLVYDTNPLGELLLTAIPNQLTKGQIFGSKTGVAIIAKQSVTFFLELNHDTLTIWYQIDQCHFTFTAESLVPYLKLCGLLTQTCTSIFSTRYRLQLNGRKAFHNQNFLVLLRYPSMTTQS